MGVEEAMKRKPKNTEDEMFKARPRIDVANSELFIAIERKVEKKVNLAST